MKVKFLLLLVSVLFLSSCNGTDDDFKMKGEPMSTRLCSRLRVQTIGLKRAS